MFNLTPQERNVALFLVGTLVIGSGVLFFKNRHFKEVKPYLVKAHSQPETKINQAEESLVVHLAGAVFRPGLYRVKKGTRVGEVLTETNLKVEADISSINLARTLIDGEKIFIPVKAPAQGDSLRIPSLSVNAIEKGKSGEFLNINQADVFQLARLPAIGEILSQRIIDYRKETGPFKSKEEIQKVRGIGLKRFEKIKDLISVD